MAKLRAHGQVATKTEMVIQNACSGSIWYQPIAVSEANISRHAINHCATLSVISTSLGRLVNALCCKRII